MELFISCLFQCNVISLIKKILLFKMSPFKVHKIIKIFSLPLYCFASPHGSDAYISHHNLC